MSDDDDDFISFGKPLKELVEGENIRKRPISVEEQIATDGNGKRRFHGAFTGGFSAGFFNTVDTPQGWAPAQFKSSRDTRPDRQSQRPEDFMDSEDFGDFGFAPHAVKTKSKFQSSKSEESARAPEKELFAPVLNQLIQPAPPTIGESLLRKQGWKPGQGIGPKAIKKNKNDRKSSYSRTYTGVSDASKAEEEEDANLIKYQDFLFAPDDLPVYVATPKENLFGMGYRGLERPGRQGPTSSSFNVKTGVHKKKFSISGEAFGVGAYEEDDEDVYNRNDLGQYDFVLDDGPSSRTKKSSSKDSPMLSQLTEMLEGFRMGTSRSQLKKTFPPPVLPRNWKPSTTGFVRKSRFEKVTEQEPVRSTTNPTRDQRRSTLFPDVRPPEILPKEEVKQESAVKEEPAEIPDFLLAQDSKAIAQSSFKPFHANPAKQTRYEQYLVCLENNRKDALKILQPKDMTEWERERERVEFERAAHLFRPMKMSMASRFVSAGSSKDALETGSESSGVGEKRSAASLKMFGKLTRETVEWVPARILCVRFNIKNPHGNHKEPETKKKFGANQLFSLLDGAGGKENEDSNQPNGRDARTVKVEQQKVTLVKDEAEEIVAEKPPMDLFKAIFANSDSESEDDESDEAQQPNESNIDEGENGKESEVIEIDSNGDAGDVDDSDSDDVYGPRPITNADANSQDKKKKLSDERFKVRAGQSSRERDASRERANVKNSKPSAPSRDFGASGIFAGIDFDKFVKRRKKTPPPIVRERVAPTRPKSILDRSIRQVLGIKSGDTSDGDYGPPLPPAATNVEKIVISSDSDSGDWEEKTSEKKKKQKKDKKKKEKKKKKKHKKDH